MNVTIADTASGNFKLLSQLLLLIVTTVITHILSLISITITFKITCTTNRNQNNKFVYTIVANVQHAENRQKHCYNN